MNAEDSCIQTSEQYICISCSHGINQDSYMEFLNLKLCENKDHQTALGDDVNFLMQECQLLKAQYDSIIGEKEKQLLQVLEQIKVMRQAYHGNVFIGNHCKKILKNYKMLCEVVQDDPVFYNQICEIFSVYAEIQQLISPKKFLAQEVRDRVKERCTRFGEKYPVYFQNENISRKIHMLIFYVPRFLEKHHTLGLLSEEEGESLHKLVNQQLRQYHCVRDKGEQLSLIVNQIEILNQSDRSLKDPKPRK